MDIIFTLTERLKYLMKKHQVRAAPLARAASLNESAVRDILRGRSKNPGIVTLQKIASVLNLRPSALYECGQAWPIVGSVAADGLINKNGEETAPKMGVENPFFYFREENYAAIVERSGSIAPLAFEGDYLIFDQAQTELKDADLGRPCLCSMDDGRTLVRVPRLGDEPGLYHLTPVSMYGSPELNKRVSRAARIVMTLPAEFAPALPTPTHVVSTELQEEQAPYADQK